MLGESAHSLSASTVAQRKRVEKDINFQWENLQLQLEQVEKKNHDLIKSRKKLTEELEKKSRESKFFEKQCQEQQRELQSIRSRLETTTKINGLGPRGKALQSIGITSLQDAKNINLTLEQLKNAKFHNEKLQSDLAKAQQEAQEKSLRMKVLEDALVFRSEEIGLAGHADLLAKVAQLKGEIRALKDELSDKTQRISDIQEDKSKLAIEYESLSQQIATIQQRLAQSQQEAYKYANSDLGILLKNAEKERDVLIDFIQQDMEKSSTLAKQLEKLDTDLRESMKREQSLQNDAQQLRSENELLMTQVSKLTQEKEFALAENNHLSIKIEQSQHLCDSLHFQLGHKSREEDEIMKHQLSLFAQLRAKDEELMRKSEEIICLRAKAQDCDITLPSLRHDNEFLKKQLQQQKEEIIHHKNKAIEFESENKALSMTASRVEQENSKLNTLCHEQSIELQDLRLLKLLLEDLDNDLRREDSILGDDVVSPGTPFSQLQHVSFSSPLMSSPFCMTPTKEASSATKSYDLISQLTSQARLSSPEKHKSCFTTPVTNSKTARENQHLTCSQQHAQWISLPSIRKVHPRLYEKIRHLAQDLHKKEIECDDLHHRYEKLLSHSTNNLKDSEGRIAYLTSCHHGDQEKLTTLTGKLHTLESEYYELKDAKVCLNQIRTVISALSTHPLLQEIREKGNYGLEDSIIEGRSISLSHLRAISAQQLDLERIADTALPNIIQELLAANAQAVLTVRDTLEVYRRLESDHREMSSKAQQLQKVTSEQALKIQVLENDLAVNSRKLQVSENDTQQQLNTAAELAEKQNALVFSLEAKVESLHRDKQLKSAQISAIQQREETLKGKLLSHFGKENRRIPFANPTLSDLVQLLLEPSYISSFDDVFHTSSRGEQVHSDRYNARGSGHFSSRAAYEAPRRDGFVDGHELKHPKYEDESPSTSRNISDFPMKRSASPLYLRDEAARTSIRDSHSVHSHSHERPRSNPRGSSASSTHGNQSVGEEHGSSIASADRVTRSSSSRRPIMDHSSNDYDSRYDQTRRDCNGSETHHSNSFSTTQSSGPSAAALALQDRIKKAQQNFRAMRESSSKNQ